MIIYARARLLLFATTRIYVCIYIYTGRDHLRVKEREKEEVMQEFGVFHSEMSLSCGVCVCVMSQSARIRREYSTREESIIYAIYAQLYTVYVLRRKPGVHTRARAGIIIFSTFWSDS